MSFPIFRITFGGDVFELEDRQGHFGFASPIPALTLIEPLFPVDSPNIRRIDGACSKSDDKSHLLRGPHFRRLGRSGHSSKDQPADGTVNEPACQIVQAITAELMAYSDAIHADDERTPVRILRFDQSEDQPVPKPKTVFLKPAAESDPLSPTHGTAADPPIIVGLDVNGESPKSAASPRPADDQA